ncbi:unnamed protein product, partial [Gongylonema pulchrum]|uniref:Porin n=1 Tax=Gongylonema pulchrum TaxID=637853 RepID=A0A183D718_9BILA
MILRRDGDTVNGNTVPEFQLFSFPHGSTRDLADVHLTLLSDAEYFMFNKIWYPVFNQSISIYGSSGYNNITETGLWQSLNIVHFNSTAYGNNVGARSTSLMNMVKYGGYNMGGQSHSYGAFLELVPSWSQLVTGSVGF